MAIRMLIKWILCSISLATSSLFAVAGSSILLSGDAPRSTALFGGAVLVYSVFGVIFLVRAWMRSSVRLVFATKASAIAMVALMVVGSLDVGMISDLEWAGIAIVALLCAMQCLAVQLVVRSHVKPSVR